MKQTPWVDKIGTGQINKAPKKLCKYVIGVHWVDKIGIWQIKQTPWVDKMSTGSIKQTPWVDKIGTGQINKAPNRFNLNFRFQGRRCRGKLLRFLDWLLRFIGSAQIFTKNSLSFLSDSHSKFIQGMSGRFRCFMWVGLGRASPAPQPSISRSRNRRNRSRNRSRSRSRNRRNKRNRRYRSETGQKPVRNRSP